MIQERAQARIVGVTKRRMLVRERVRHRGERPPQILRQQILVRHVVRHLAEAVHVVGEGEQARLDLVLGQHAKGVAHHRGARDLAERADMRQAGRPVAGLEQHLVLRAFLQPRDNGLRLLERPGVGLFGERTKIARAHVGIDNGHQGASGPRKIAISGQNAILWGGAAALHRHCERSEAIQNLSAETVWIASSQALLAMTAEGAAIG